MSEQPSNKKTAYARYFKSTRGYEHDVVVESPGAKPIWANGNTSDTGLDNESQCEAALDLSEVLDNVVEVIKVDCDSPTPEPPPPSEPSNVTVPCETTRELIQVLIDGDHKGIGKYGQTVDRKDFDGRRWLREWLGEWGDAGKYAKATLRELDAAYAENAALREKVDGLYAEVKRVEQEARDISKFDREKSEASDAELRTENAALKAENERLKEAFKIPKRDGMVISLAGVLQRAAEHCKRHEDSEYLSYSLRELNDHIELVRSDPTRIGTFLSLYVGT
jgi:hypothetical protein